MTSTARMSQSCKRKDHKQWSQSSLGVGAHLEKSDRQSGREYIPMNVFVDPGTLKEHFQNSSIRIRARWTNIHPAAT